MGPGFESPLGHHVGAKSALLRRFFMLTHKKRHPPAPLFLLSKSQPLRWVAIWVWVQTWGSPQNCSLVPQKKDTLLGGSIKQHRNVFAKRRSFGYAVSPFCRSFSKGAGSIPIRSYVKERAFAQWNICHMRKQRKNGAFPKGGYRNFVRATAYPVRVPTSALEYNIVDITEDMV